MRPGEIRFAETSIRINPSRSAISLRVRNASSHTVQISSHFHFYEVNRRLMFDREPAYGRHLDLPAGRSVRFAPGEVKDVRLVPYAGARVVQGFNGLARGSGGAA